VGDIGTDEDDLEKRLVKWFQLAEKWGAVVLIDEADVYLERREVADLQRNSLVSGKLIPNNTENWAGLPGSWHFQTEITEPICLSFGRSSAGSEYVPNRQ
jgi:hypothetical protein